MALNMKDRNSALKRALKAAGHKAIDPDGVEHIEHAAGTLDKSAFIDCEDPAADAGVRKFQPLRGVDAGAVLDADDDDAKGHARIYVFIFATLCATYAECKDGQKGNAALVANVMEVLSKAQAAERAPDSLDGIIDDDICALLERVGEAAARVKAGADAGDEKNGSAVPDVEALVQSLENSKIGNMAKEITSELDIGKLADSQSPADLLNFANLTDGNSMLGNIVSKVGSKMQQKLASGELKQEELLAETMSVLKALGCGLGGGSGGANAGSGGGAADLFKAFAGNDVMSSFMKTAAAAAMGGSNPRGAAPSMLRRERLREKLAKKNAN